MSARRLWAVAVLLLGVLMVSVGCAKRPDAEVAAVKAAVGEARNAGAPEYVPDAFKAVESSLQKAQEEVKAQDDRFVLFRSYNQATQSLARVKADAEKVKADAAAAKEKAKAEAEAARKEAQEALDAAKAALAKAPKGKGSKADIAAMRTDLQAAEATLAEAGAAFDKQDYLGAKAKAGSAKEKAAAVSAQIEQARAKVKAAAGKPKKG